MSMFALIEDGAFRAFRKLGLGPRSRRRLRRVRRGSGWIGPLGRRRRPRRPGFEISDVSDVTTHRFHVKLRKMPRTPLFNENLLVDAASFRLIMTEIIEHVHLDLSPKLENDRNHSEAF